MSADTLARGPVQPPSPPPAPEDPQPWPVGRGVLGGLLVVAGVLWLFDAVGVAELRLRVLLPAALLLVGLVLLATARRGTHGGLVATGIVLSVLLFVFAANPVSTPLALVGDRTVSPHTVAALQDGYELGMGSLTIDLRDVDVPGGGAEVSARVGMGELVVVLPEGVGAEVRARAGVGDVTVMDADRGGVGVSVNQVVPGSPAIVLDVRVGLGSVEVRR